MSGFQDFRISGFQEFSDDDGNNGKEWGGQRGSVESLSRVHCSPALTTEECYTRGATPAYGDLYRVLS